MTPRPSTERLLVQVFLHGMDELLIALSQHGPDSEESIRAEEDLKLSVAPLWHRISRLELRCMSDGIWWEGERVLATGEGGSPLLSTLASSGIQTLVLHPGVEDGDLRRLVELVDEKGRLDPDGEKDLVMMLFQADLPHVHYSVRAPDGAREAPTRSPKITRADPEAVRKAVRADAAGDRRGVVDLEDFDSTLYFLDEPEIEYLRSQVERQYTTDHARNALALLLDTLELREEVAVRDEAISAMRTFLPYLLASGNFSVLAYLTSELREILRNGALQDEHRSTLSELLESISEKGTLTQIFLQLEEGRLAPTANELGVLLGELDAAALETVLAWSGQLHDPDTKSALVTALEDFFREWPAYLVRALTSRDRAVVQRGLMMAGRLRLPELVEGVAVALEHDDPTSRRLAVEVLASIADSVAMREVTKVLRDPDSKVRMAAYRAFLSRPYRSAAQSFRRVLSSTDPEDLGLSERKLLFSAYGAVVGSAGVSELQPILAGKRISGHRPSSETRACAALALEHVDSRSARDALEAATRYRDPLVRSAASSALQSMRS